jgi:hypothetical protein
MSNDKIAQILVLAIGIGLLLASLLADVIGIGDNPGFGSQQTLGTIAGALITACGVYLYMRSAKSE